MLENTRGRRIYRVFNAFLLILLALVCLLPVLHILALSLSSASASMAGKVSIFPVQFTTANFKIVLSRKDFLDSFVMSIQRVILGASVNMFFIVTLAYPLSKERSHFHMRTAYAWILMFTMLFSGGLIPTYLVMRQLGLIDTVWALIMPGAVPVWNTVLMMNFFRSLPREIEESAFIDGSGHMRVLFQIYIPLSAPAIASILLFCIVGHWNAWFDGMIYINKTNMYPMQTFLRLINVASQAEAANATDVEYLRGISDKSVRAAQVFIAMLPVLCVYPFLQKYFTKGIVMGSVKG
jgi:putative aldouronate transport system permease protein